MLKCGDRGSCNYRISTEFTMSAPFTVMYYDVFVIYKLLTIVIKIWMSLECHLWQPLRRTLPTMPKYAELSISVTVKVTINEQNKLIATGTHYYTLSVKLFERSYLKMWRFWTWWGIGSHNIGTMIVQNTEIHFHKEKWFSTKCSWYC